MHRDVVVSALVRCCNSMPLLHMRRSALLRQCTELHYTVQSFCTAESSITLHDVVLLMVCHVYVSLICH